MQNKLCFAQFLHPGGEHQPDYGTIMRWNRQAFPHKRKFVKEDGRYIANGEVHNGVVAFWTEWEAESTVVNEIFEPIPNGPRYVYEPFYIVPESYEGLQNTDPFVFGAQFHYTGCQQRTKRGPTQLERSARKDIPSIRRRNDFSLVSRIICREHFVRHW